MAEGKSVRIKQGEPSPGEHKAALFLLHGKRAFIQVV